MGRRTVVVELNNVCVLHLYLSCFKWALALPKARQVENTSSIFSRKLLQLPTEKNVIEKQYTVVIAHTETFLLIGMPRLYRQHQGFLYKKEERLYYEVSDGRGRLPLTFPRQIKFLASLPEVANTRKCKEPTRL